MQEQQQQQQQQQQPQQPLQIASQEPQVLYGIPLDGIDEETIKLHNKLKSAEIDIAKKLGNVTSV